MISAMPAVAVRRERKKQQSARAAAAAAAANGCPSRRGSSSSLPSPSTRSSSLLSSPISQTGNYYSYFAAQRQQRRPSAVSAPAATTTTTPTASLAPPSRRPTGTSVSTISSAASNYVSALHRVRERRLEARRERARFLAYAGSVLVASGAVLSAIGLAARATAAQTVGPLFLGLGCALCLARVFCLPRDELPLVVGRASVYAAPVRPPASSAATTPGTDDSSTASSCYFSAVPLHRVPALQSPETPPAAPPLQPPPPVAPSVHGAGGGHRGNPSSLLTPMSLNSIPEMQVLITDDSQRY